MGCSEFSYDGWLNRPLGIQIGAGGSRPEVLLAWEHGASFRAVLDSGSPLTLLAAVGGANARARGELRLRDAGRKSVTRFIFRNVDARGLPASAGVAGVLGADLLGRFSVRLRLSVPSLTLRDEIPDRSQDIALDCDVDRVDGTPAQRCTAVFATPRRGGGLGHVGGEDIQIPATRLAVGVCLQPPPVRAGCGDQVERGGLPVAAVIATGLDTSIISRAALRRLQGEDPTIVEVAAAATPGAPYGTARLPAATVTRLAIVGNRTADLGPCRELAWRRKVHACRTTMNTASLTYAGAATAELSQKVTLAVAEDTSPLFVGLRQELGPSVPDVELIIGANLLRRFELDLDYPKDRTMLRCAAGSTVATCRVLPSCEIADLPLCLPARR